MESKSSPKVLTEEDILRLARQYDVELLFAVSVRSHGFTALGDSLIHCKSLTTLDIRGNNLTSLSGIDAIRETLTYLDAAENQLSDTSALAHCEALECLFVEGNQLDDISAFAVLAKLPKLDEVMVRRALILDGGEEPLVIDNPVCRDDIRYEELCSFLHQTIRWVDGRTIDSRRGLKKDTERGSQGDARVAAEKRLDQLTKQALTADETEREFVELLARNQKKVVMKN